MFIFGDLTKSVYSFTFILHNNLDYIIFILILLLLHMNEKEKNKRIHLVLWAK